MTRTSRREFIREVGIGAATLPFILNLPSLGFANQQRRKRRLVVMFSPNGVVPGAFWPDEEGAKFTLKESRQAARTVSRTALLFAAKGFATRFAATATTHMRGIGCLLDRRRTLPWQHSGWLATLPAGLVEWSFRSIRRSRTHLQKARPETRTRFGSLEMGVLVPGPCRYMDPHGLCRSGNKPLAPIDDPYQMFAKLYGRVKDRAASEEHPRRRSGRS